MNAEKKAVVEQALLDPAFYPHRPAIVELVETHISRVFLAEGLVYKSKKPVRFDFLDFSTPELRRQACEAEVQLNRRLAPNVYLGVVPITEANGVLSLGGAGTPVDWLVKMKRLDTYQSLEHAIHNGTLHPAEVDRLAETLASFYRSLPPATVNLAQYLDNLVHHVQQNREELLTSGHHLNPVHVKQIHEQQLRLLHLHPELFEDRVAAGKIVEGHGDLRPEHILLTEPVVIFDCIEFSKEFRTLDVADELAFLASECDHLGAMWIGPLLLAKCSQLLGDKPPSQLVNFYKSYRACVRAKVAALRSSQLTEPAQTAATAQATAYLAQAHHYCSGQQHPFLIVVAGLSGTGKSTLAREIGVKLGVEVLRSDSIRGEMFGRPNNSELNAGIYREDLRTLVYDRLLQRADKQLHSGLSVILDATFESQDALASAWQLARRHGASFHAIRCVCPPEVALERIGRRERIGNDASQANVAVYQQQRQRAQSWSGISHVVVDTTLPLEAQQEVVWSELRLAE